jgi:hypothetical protein
MSRIDSDEVIRIEQLSVNWQQEKEQRQKRQDVEKFDENNAQKIKKIVIWDEDRVFYEAADEIRNQMRGERILKENEFYSIWVQK